MKRNSIDLHTVKWKGFLIIAFISLVGFIIRLLCCYWGKPLLLHPDEGATIDYVIDMLQRHSWEAHSYDRPDHFEIKCDAILFTIVSWVKYHKPAYEAFADHKMAFYMLGRFYTALFGTAMIPLTYTFTGKLAGNAISEKYRKIVQITASVLIACSSIFVQHSAYATPEIVLTFFVMLFAYGSMRYIEDGSKRWLYACMVIIGIGVTIKYSAAILCLPLAGMIIFRVLWIDHKPMDIVRYGFMSIGVIFLTIFILAPNLITDIETVYVNFMEEARPNHLGADGLGFWGNLRYYFNTITSSVGSVSIFPFVVGILFACKCKDRKLLSLLVGCIYWVCMSILSLHWLRWGIPMYPFYIIIAALGIGEIFVGLEAIKEKHHLKIVLAGQVLAAALALLVVLNAVLSGICITKYSLLPDMRYVALNYLNENGITTDNTLYEGYTPFLPSSAASKVDSFVVTEDGVQVTIQNAAKQYFLMSNSLKSRYLAESNRYSEQCTIYNGIDESYEVIYRETGNGNYETNKNLLKNIKNSLTYLMGDQTTIGDTITVYDLNPDYVVIQTKDGYSLSAASEESGAGIYTSEETYQWVRYNVGDGVYALLSGNSGLALDVTGENFSQETQLELESATGDVSQQWQIIEEGDHYYLVCENNMALTYLDGTVGLSEFTQDENQRWYIK